MCKWWRRNISCDEKRFKNFDKLDERQFSINNSVQVRLLTIDGISKERIIFYFFWLQLHQRTNRYFIFNTQYTLQHLQKKENTCPLKELKICLLVLLPKKLEERNIPVAKHMRENLKVMIINEKQLKNTENYLQNFILFLNKLYRYVNNTCNVPFFRILSKKIYN